VDVALVRDWVIIIAGSLGIIVLILVTVMSTILFYKILAITNHVKKIACQVDQAISSPYYQLASWLGGIWSGFKQRMQKDKK
jgi:hypothetical protein